MSLTKKLGRDDIIVKVNLQSPIPTSFYITVANYFIGCSETRLLTWHNQQSAQCSPDPFPHERLGMRLLVNRCCASREDGGGTAEGGQVWQLNSPWLVMGGPFLTCFV